ncbi:MAG: hypothetical protein KGJ23_05875 [Euryarchaeota archaeon]|nr:hypothetical protein [Euryarchaeota archaeon]MDE1836127.1 hypothetical protein [Euryarchaeota archaeon]MDE1879417.1 hypothetical protein [Euryarchaeota archaeon]MDE2044105.1 hypothetical protein [Thermoplasmata archaeon]
MYAQPALPIATKNLAGGEAETYILIGLICQILSSLGFLLFVFVFFGVLGVVSSGFWVIGGLIVAVIVFMLFAAWEWSYSRTKRGNYEGARGVTLLLGILGIFFGLLPGIFYLLAYGKLDDAIQERTRPMVPVMMFAHPGYAYAPPPGYVMVPATPMAAPLPSAPVLMASPPPHASAPACLRCGKTATWIPQYQRHYCYGCSLYV